MPNREFEIKLTPKSKKYLRDFPDLARKGAYEGLQKAMYGVERRAVNHYGDNGLKVVTGNLRNSIKGKAYKVDRDTLIGILSARPIYASVHEFGKTIHHDNLFGKGISATIKIKERSYLRPAIEFKMNFIKNLVGKHIKIATGAK